jgi:hypothetical protein
MPDHLHPRSDFAAMSQFFPENKIHETWVVEENAFLLYLSRRDGLKWKFLTKFMIDRNISEIKRRRPAILKKRMDVILSNTNKMINVRSNIKEQPFRSWPDGLCRTHHHSLGPFQLRHWLSFQGLRLIR